MVTRVWYGPHLPVIVVGATHRVILSAQVRKGARRAISQEPECMVLIRRSTFRAGLGIGVRRSSDRPEKLPSALAQPRPVAGKALAAKSAAPKSGPSWLRNRSFSGSSCSSLRRGPPMTSTVKPQQLVSKTSAKAPKRIVSGRRGVGCGQVGKPNASPRLGASTSLQRAMAGGSSVAKPSGSGPKVIKAIEKCNGKLAGPIPGTWRITPLQRSVLDSWGPRLAQRLAAARQEWFRSRRGVGESGRLTLPAVKVGTDCSGAEAPIWALKAMQIPHEHVFSCDWQESVRSFIRATSPPTGPIFTDMLKRKCDDIPGIDVYVCGFPCTPFSALRAHSTRLLREEAAKPFFKVLEVLRSRQPKLAVLENVFGIRQVMKRILRCLRELRIYWVICLPIDPQDLGEPVSRPRFYFLLVRRDVGVLTATEDIRCFVGAMAHAAHEPVTSHVATRMIPKDTPYVQNYLKKLMQKGEGGLGVGQPAAGTPKWPREHECFRVARGLRPVGHVSVCLPTQRMRSAWHLLRQQAGQDIIGDFSQSLNRVTVRTDGVCPTITPKGMIFVGGRGVDRVVTPREKLLLHLFPLHKMQIPSDFPEEELAKMGGNTMHLKSVGLALTIGLALVDFSRSGASMRGPAEVGPAMPAIELPLNTVRQGL